MGLHMIHAHVLGKVFAIFLSVFKDHVSTGFTMSRRECCCFKIWNPSCDNDKLYVHAFDYCVCCVCMIVIIQVRTIDSTCLCFILLGHIN